MHSCAWLINSSSQSSSGIAKEHYTQARRYRRLGSDRSKLHAWPVSAIELIFHGIGRYSGRSVSIRNATTSVTRPSAFRCLFNVVDCYSNSDNVLAHRSSPRATWRHAVWRTSHRVPYIKQALTRCLGNGTILVQVTRKLTLSQRNVTIATADGLSSSISALRIPFPSNFVLATKRHVCLLSRRPQTNHFIVHVLAIGCSVCFHRPAPVSADTHTLYINLVSILFQNLSAVYDCLYYGLGLKRRNLFDKI